MGEGIVSWNSRRQQTVALSTAEAEYMALSARCQEAIFLKTVMEDLEGEMSKPIVIRVDNQAAIAIAKDQMSTKRTKHIDIRCHFVRDLIEKKILSLEYVPTQEQMADCLTKALKKDALERFTKRLMEIKPIVKIVNELSHFATIMKNSFRGSVEKKSVLHNGKETESVEDH